MKKVYQYTRDMVQVATYHSVRECASVVGLSAQSISMSCRGLLNGCGGYIFSFGQSEEEKKVSPVENKDKALDLYDRCLNFALSLTCNLEDSKDLVQEAFLKYYDSDTTGEEAYNFLMHTIKYEWVREDSRRKCAEDIKGFEFCLSSKETESREDRMAREHMEDVHRSVLYELVSNALKTIKTEKRRKRINKIFHWYLDGLSAAEIGQKMNINVSAAKMDIIKMRKFISEALDIPMREFTQYNCKIA